MSKFIYISEESGDSAERGGLLHNKVSKCILYLECSIWLLHTLWSDPILELPLLLKM